MSKKPIWGVKWGQVGSGILMLLGGGIPALLAYLGGIVWFLPIAIAFLGLCLVLMGLIGEESVW